MLSRIWAMLQEMVKNFDGEILSYRTKLNVIVDALSWKSANEPLWECCLRTTMFTPLLEFHF